MSTSILNKALDTSLTSGKLHVFNLSGVTYTGNDLPDANYSYGMALIFKRNVESIKILLIGDHGGARRIAENCHNGTSWSGWNSYTIKSDLAEKDISDQISFSDSNYARLDKATYKCGFVYIKCHIKGKIGVNTFGTISTKYAPSENAYGYLNCESSYNNKELFSSFGVNTDGSIFSWCTGEMSAREVMTVMYPVNL